MLFRTGFGYDAHRLVRGRPLILGGVTIPHDFGLAGHSDADVLTHALMDAILGALSRGDIGRHFPDKDPAFKDMDSLRMLKKVSAWIKEDGFRINNADCTLVAEKPRIAAYAETMKQRLSEILEIRPDQINIKATTTEGMGPSGRSEGMEAFAFVSLTGRSNPE